MDMYMVKHRCGCDLTVIDETYKGGNFPYCKRCRINVKLTSFDEKTNEFEFRKVSVPVSVPVIIEK